MTDFTDFLGRVLRGLFKLALLALTLAFLLGLLLMGGVAALFILLWSLITGRKPALVTAFSMFRRASEQFRPPTDAEVVDVQAREMDEKQPNAPAQPLLFLTDEAVHVDTPSGNKPP
jgi:hypothetical protein